MAEYIEFARANDMPFFGAASTITIVEWLDALRARWDSVPQQGMHALTVFNESLELNLNLEHPAIKISKKDNPQKAAQASTVSANGFHSSGRSNSYR